VKGVLFEN
jgi:Fe-S-cluster containining protein